MKRTNITLLALLLWNIQLIADPPPPVLQGKDVVTKYEVKKGQCLFIPTGFNNSAVSRDNIKASLFGKSVTHIDLVYTSYKESPSFDQQALNKRRVDDLLSTFPEVQDYDPTWNMVEQTGAQSAKDARGFFHGFAVYLREGIDYRKVMKYLKDLTVPFAVHDVDNSEDKVIEGANGSSISVSAGAVLNPDGTPVKGSYKLMYREFRNQADIALSGIPMTYTNGAGEYNFSSNGMFELRAMKDGKELRLQKPIKVDFDATAPDDGVAFYQMEDENGSWDELKEIKFKGKNGNNRPNHFGDKRGERKKLARWKFIKVTDDNKMGFWVWRTDCRPTGDDKCHLKMNNPAWKVYQFIKKGDFKMVDSLVVSEDPGTQCVKVKKDCDRVFRKMITGAHRQNAHWDGFALRTFRQGLWVKPGSKFEQERFIPQAMNQKPVKRDGTKATLLAEGADAGHTYPKLVKGLNCKDFGVYNCDQIYRLGKVLALVPKYVDEDGKEIDQAHVANVIDLNYNGAFSFHPDIVQCNPDGKNAFLLFTKDKRVYMINPDEFKETIGDGMEQNVTFRMKEVTSSIKSPNDLKAALGI